VVVATKVDKLSKQKAKESLEYLRESLALPDDEPIPFSSKTGEGKRELWMRITEIAQGAD
jgi:GTP-binding protein EngB required for normal cell division